MREYSFTIAASGLAEDPDALEGMQVLKNLKPEASGWSVPVLPAIQTGWTDDLQVFRCRSMTLVCGATSIGLVDEETLGNVPMVTVASGGAWTVADFGPMVVACNGVDAVAVTAPPLDASALVLDGVPFGVCAAHMDTRLVYGNTVAGGNWVGWSTVGGEDIPGILLGQAITARLASLNEANAAPMPWRGDVLAILPMRERFIVYGEDGVTALTVARGTYGFEWLEGLPSGVGIAGRGAVAGDDGAHAFVGTDGALYMVTRDLRCQRVRKDLDIDSPRVSHDPVNAEWWIAGETNSYLLGKHGLGGPIEARIMSIAVIGGTVCATGTGYPYPNAVLAEMWTNIFDAGDSARKRVTYVRVGADGVTGLRVAGRIAHGTGS